MAKVRFQLDEHIPNAVLDGLRRRGIDAASTADAGLLGTSDVEQLAHAYAAERVFVTHDDDFLRLHRAGHSHAGIAYCQPGSRSIGEMIVTLVLIYEILDSADMVGRVEFL